MNVLLFCSNPVNGGTARIFCEIIRSLRENSKDISLFACVNEGNPVEVYKKIDGICYLPVYSEQALFKEMYGNKGLSRITSFFFRKISYRHIRKNNVRHMQKYLLDLRIDTVVIHNGGYVGDDLCNQMLEAAYLCRSIVRKRIIVWHNDMEKGFIRKIRYFLYDKKVDREATAFVTVSEYTKGRIEDSSYLKKDIRVIYNGLSDNRMLGREEKEKTIGRLERSMNVLMIGNFTENKGQIKLIKACKYLEHLDIGFTIIGNVYDEAYYNLCCQKIIDWKLGEKIRILHGIHNASEYIEMFDVLAVTSLYDESFGLISLEAMIAHCPVIAFQCGGIPEVVEDKKSGIIVPIGDSRKLAQTIEWMYRHPDERKRMGLNGEQRYKEKFSAEAMREKYERIIKE